MNNTPAESNMITVRHRICLTLACTRTEWYRRSFHERETKSRTAKTRALARERFARLSRRVARGAHPLTPPPPPPSHRLLRENHPGARRATPPRRTGPRNFRERGNLREASFPRCRTTRTPRRTPPRTPQLRRTGARPLTRSPPPSHRLLREDHPGARRATPPRRTGPRTRGNERPETLKHRDLRNRGATKTFPRTPRRRRTARASRSRQRRTRRRTPRRRRARASRKDMRGRTPCPS